MNEILIGLVLFCFIVFMIETEKKNNLIIKNMIDNIKINSNYNSDDNADTTDTSDNSQQTVVLTYNNTPDFRGYVDLYHPPDIKEEGGSKPFNDHIINDNNLMENQVNYNKYESYRKKPYKILEK